LKPTTSPEIAAAVQTRPDRLSGAYRVSRLNFDKNQRIQAVLFSQLLAPRCQIRLASQGVAQPVECRMPATVRMTQISPDTAITQSGAKAPSDGRENEWLLSRHLRDVHHQR